MERLRREAGLVITHDREKDRPIGEVRMVQCVHCGKHFPAESKNIGFCMNCNGFYCGARCEVCIPLEQWLDNVENKASEAFKPTRIFVPPSYPARTKA